jgi:tRNA pseudouridine38-40 synthase
VRTLKLVVAYDGSAYCGWQLQPNGITVQQVVEEAIGKILGPHRTLVAGRTDSGVHALGQVVALRTGKTMPPEELMNAMNFHLPPDIAVRSIEEVSNDFDPRKSAVSKLYRYRVWNEFVRPVLVRNQVWHVYGVDWNRVELALPALLGKHDFKSFEGANSNAANAIRTLTRVALIRDPAPNETWLEFEGDGFVKHMVRNMVGTLVEVGRKQHPPKWVAEVIEKRDRKSAGAMAPAAGLTLVEVRY